MGSLGPREQGGTDGSEAGLRRIVGRVSGCAPRSGARRLRRRWKPDDHHYCRSRARARADDHHRRSSSCSCADHHQRRRDGQHHHNPMAQETTTSVDASTTTTEKLSTAESRLANGHIKAMGFIRKVWEQGGKRYISIDYAEMLTGQAAIEAAIAAGEIQPGEDLPNDYYIRNTNPALRQFQVSDTAAITTSTWQGVLNKPVTWAEFTSFWSPTPPDQEAAYLKDSPWWIERDGQTVVKIDEQYLP